MRTLVDKLYWNCFTLWHARREARLPFWSPDRIAELQGRRVRSMVAHAYASVPFYREAMDRAGLRPRDFRSADDLPRLPFVTGNDIVEAPERFTSRRFSGDRVLSLFSSGTSGRPKNILHDRAGLFMMMAFGHRQREVLAHYLGGALGYRELVVCPKWSVSFQLRDFYSSLSWVPAGLDFKRAALWPEGRIEDNLGRINSFRPDLIRGYGSYIGTLFHEAFRRGVELHRPRAVLYGADPMADSHRRLIEDHFGVPVLSGYQSTEFLRIAYQCERREGFHINLDHVAVRVLDGDGRQAGPGERGEIVVSNLVNRAMVLLNYRLGDMVTLAKEPCPCGRSLPTLVRIDGRTRDLVLLPDGEIIHSSVMMPDIQSIPGVVQVQVTQHSPGNFSILVVCDAGADWQAARTAIESVLITRFGRSVLVDIERADAIPPDAGGKTRPFVSKCLS